MHDISRYPKFYSHLRSLQKWRQHTCDGREGRRRRGEGYPDLFRWRNRSNRCRLIWTIILSILEVFWSRAVYQLLSRSTEIARSRSARATPVEKLGGEGDGIVPSWLVQRNRGNRSKRCKLIGQYSFQTKIAVPPHSRFWSKSNTPPPLSRNINILQVAPLKSTRLAERKASDTRDWTLET